MIRRGGRVTIHGAVLNADGDNLSDIWSSIHRTDCGTDGCVSVGQASAIATMLSYPPQGDECVPPLAVQMIAEAAYRRGFSHAVCTIAFSMATPPLWLQKLTHDTNDWRNNENLPQRISPPMCDKIKLATPDTPPTTVTIEDIDDEGGAW